MYIYTFLARSFECFSHWQLAVRISHYIAGYEYHLQVLIEIHSISTMCIHERH